MVLGPEVFNRTEEMFCFILKYKKVNNHIINVDLRWPCEMKQNEDITANICNIQYNNEDRPSDRLSVWNSFKVTLYNTCNSIHEIPVILVMQYKVT